MYRLLAAESRSECKASPAFVSGVNAKNFSLINVAAGTSALDMIASARAARAGGTSLISSLALAGGRVEKKAAIGSEDLLASTWRAFSSDRRAMGCRLAGGAASTSPAAALSGSSAENI